MSKELGIHRSTLYQWRSNWGVLGDVVLETAGFNAAELSSYCRERGSVSWSGFSGQGPSLTSEAGHRPLKRAPTHEQGTNP